jgi:hypothetical protein
MSNTPHGSETPETDANQFLEKETDTSMVVCADFARSLERRLREALERREGASDRAEAMELWKERAEAAERKIQDLEEQITELYNGR